MAERSFVEEVKKLRLGAWNGPQNPRTQSPT